jgi:uncharacterized protein
MISSDTLISRTIEFVQKSLENAESGHDWWHIERVWKMAKRLAASESVDTTVVELAALLHDIADSKFHDGDEEIGPQIAADFLTGQNADPALVDHVQLIIRNMSYKASLGEVQFRSREMEVVQDADRLDAIGAIGIARAFTYGGYKNRPLYDPAITPKIGQTKEEYKSTTAPTINHFYEKLLLLKDLMNTDTGRAIAEQRHRFMEAYLDQFYAEWNSEA